MEKEGGAGEAKHEEDSESLGRAGSNKLSRRRVNWRGRHRKQRRPGGGSSSSDGGCGLGGRN